MPFTAAENDKYYKEKVRLFVEKYERRQIIVTGGKLDAVKGTAPLRKHRKRPIKVKKEKVRADVKPSPSLVNVGVHDQTPGCRSQKGALDDVIDCCDSEDEGAVEVVINLADNIEESDDDDIVEIPRPPSPVPPSPITVQDSDEEIDVDEDPILDSSSQSGNAAETESASHISDDDDMYVDYITPESIKNARKSALATLKEKRKLSQSRPAMVKREDTGLTRKYREPTLDLDPVEVYSSDEGMIIRPSTQRIRADMVPSRRETKWFFYEK